ncbi:mobilization protein [Porphyromonas gulae]|uniref:relaxase/mobilization nuclease domain-containing protein n=1 Tax=Porphyromonas gulae TaxID=111105 RepID=UPI00052D44EA|nr:relaxase/mobilization nuclease domain-containing protein [Porphyromonas gulae]KGN72010.1 mobilization protein [Porphyromonas gulae]KGO03832.1 mobilization protein [Porphyromonas gulae]
MIAKCKAIAHGKTALEYIFRETKLKNKLLIQNLCGDTAERICEEMNLVNQFNSRCRNKFLRIEIGIAPKDEAGMNWKRLQGIACEFIQAMKLQEHQVVAVTHKDTDNLHIHIIANRMDMNGAVYDTTFVSNKAARVAEELSRKHGLTIANEIRAKKRYQKPRVNQTREASKEKLRLMAYGLLGKYTNGGVNGYAYFRYELRRRGVTVEQMTNKKGSIYGLKFHFEGQTFKASEIGREFGYNSLLKQFGLSYTAPYHSSVPIYQPKGPLQEEKRQPTPSPEPSLVESVVDVVAEGIASGVGGVLDFQVHGEDYAETAFQRRLRHEANKRKKRGRRM